MNLHQRMRCLQCKSSIVLGIPPAVMSVWRDASRDASSSRLLSSSPCLCDTPQKQLPEKRGTSQSGFYLAIIPLVLDHTKTNTCTYIKYVLFEDSHVC